MKTSAVEPTYDDACGWWSDQVNYWTPIGWKGHMCRFNVFWNGIVQAAPYLYPSGGSRLEKWRDYSSLLYFLPNWSEDLNFKKQPWLFQDDNSVNQYWLPGEVPELRSEWSKMGIFTRQDIFAHVPGGGVLERGDEPLFAWIRLSVGEAAPVIEIPDSMHWLIAFGRSNLYAQMRVRGNVEFDRDNQVYPRELSFSRCEMGWKLEEPGGQIRLAVSANSHVEKVELAPPGSNWAIPRIRIKMAAKKGAHVDVLLGMLPQDADVFHAEWALGRKKAYAEAARFWKKRPRTAARISIPEEPINDILHRSIQFSEILGEKNPDTGRMCKINGSWWYAALWATPATMDMTMLLDTLGYHETVRDYLRIFREEQGTVKPPADGLEMHPGYLSTPALYKSIDWLSDHGALLYLLAHHGRITRSEPFAEEFAASIVRACEWVKEARASRGHGGVEGLMPAAVSDDRKEKFQSVWNDGWNFKGLLHAAKYLGSIGHPRAAEFLAEAEDYRETFVKSYRARCRKMPKWKDASGVSHILPAPGVSGDRGGNLRHPFYLDTGPMFLVFAELMPASDPLMQSIVGWFREGPQRAWYRSESNFEQMPVLEREMSSIEPCYSWNVFHSWQTGDRGRFLEGFYSLLAGSLSRKTHIACETRHGISGTVFSTPLITQMMRLAVIDDQLHEDELHLLRLVPEAWLEGTSPLRMENMPTFFGPVSLVAVAGGRKLSLTITAKFHTSPKRVLLHIPARFKNESLSVNGHRLKPSKRPVSIADLLEK